LSNKEANLVHLIYRNSDQITLEDRAIEHIFISLPDVYGGSVK